MPAEPRLRVKEPTKRSGPEAAGEKKLRTGAMQPITYHPAAERGQSGVARRRGEVGAVREGPAHHRKKAAVDGRLETEDRR